MLLCLIFLFQLIIFVIDFIYIIKISIYDKTRSKWLLVFLLKGNIMQNFTLFADTDCDITPELGSKLGFKLISMPYLLGEKEVFPYETFDKFDSHAFYETLRHGTIPKTFGLSPEKYISYFEPEFQAGKDILYAHFSSALSGTFNSMKIAIDILKEKYPERKIYSLDTKAITGLAYAILLDIAKLYKEDKSPEEIIKYVSEESIKHYAFFGFADDLKFFKKSGRVSGISATLGDILNIKPIISIDDEGKMGAIGKAQGRNGATNTLFKNMEKLGFEIQNHPIIIVHSDAPKLVDNLIASIKKKYGDNLNITVLDINPTAGVHCGPNCLGISFHSKGRCL